MLNRAMLLLLFFKFGYSFVQTFDFVDKLLLGFCHDCGMILGGTIVPDIPLAPQQMWLGVGPKYSVVSFAPVGVRAILQHSRMGAVVRSLLLLHTYQSSTFSYFPRGQIRCGQFVTTAKLLPASQKLEYIFLHVINSVTIFANNSREGSFAQLNQLIRCEHARILVPEPVGGA